MSPQERAAAVTEMEESAGWEILRQSAAQELARVNTKLESEASIDALRQLQGRAGGLRWFLALPEGVRKIAEAKP